VAAGRYGRFVVAVVGASVLAACASARADTTRPNGSRPGTASEPVAALAAATTHDDTIYAFGNATFRGSTSGRVLAAPIVAMAPTRTGGGYWLVASDGGVFTFGARYFGSAGGVRLVQPVVGMAATPSGLGYWLVARDGGVFSYGDAKFYGSTANQRLNAPIAAIVAAPQGGGYWLLAQDGGVFTFGAAHFYGSTGALALRAPVVAMAPSPTGHGYWLVAKDGGVFSFGDARFHGSAAAVPLSAPISGIARDATGKGYWLVAQDGGVFTEGDARFHGSASGSVFPSKVVTQIAALPDGTGYRLLATDRPHASAPGVDAFGDSVMIDAAPSLQAQIPGIYVDASVSRQVGAGLSALAARASSGQLRGTVVWHLGTNGTFTSAALDQVLQIAAGRHVVMLTDHCGYCGWTASNNAVIFAGCTSPRNCTVADWNALADANPQWFGGDGVHMPIGGAGAQAYARLVASSL